ncbi:MAG TPA: glycoside hydrolase family 3 N-terminal domain-containing protein, partial [Polyangiaceae bacterium]|nr:glycoside hydrolase family 3 N-terminal domain-containing protein [Polyangiaceae bacterium]
MVKTMARAGAAALLAATAAVAQPAGRGVAHPDLWPAAKSQGLVDPSTEAFVTRLLAGMSLEEKVGQMIQADVASIRPDELRRYPLGSVLAGGDSPPPGKPDRSRGPAWSAMVRAFHAVATEPRPGHTPVPLLFGVDAVHGNNNVVGATLFPHGVALGATHDPELIRRVGEATAREVAAAGIDWAFGPTLAVPQDDRWGRTFESYSEDPALVRAYAGAMIAGLQGPPGRGGVQRGWVAASAKHFVGDGGADEGVDQGNTTVSERALIDIHSAGYPPAVNAGIMTVMASFSSWQGAKAHGNRSLLVDVLKQRMGFDGFVVGDWDGHSQLPGGAKTDAAVAFNAGLDMAMASETWRGLFDNTVAQVRAGTIPPARVD